MVITDHVSIECRNNSLRRQNQHEKHKHLLCCAECLTGHGLHPFQKSTTWLCNALTSHVTPSKDFTGQERAAHKQTNQMELDFLLVGKVLGKLAAPTVLQSSSKAVPKWEGKTCLKLSLSTL